MTMERKITQKWLPRMPKAKAQGWSKERPAMSSLLTIKKTQTLAQSKEEQEELARSSQLSSPILRED